MGHDQALGLWYIPELMSDSDDNIKITVGMPPWVKSLSTLGAVAALIAIAVMQSWSNIVDREYERKAAQSSRDHLIRATESQTSAIREVIDIVRIHIADTSAAVAQQKCTNLALIEADADTLIAAECVQPGWRPRPRPKLPSFGR